MNKTVMRLILGIMLAGWMIIIFWFSNQPATESSEISGTISYRLVEDTDEIFNWGLTTDQIGNIAGNIEYPIRKAAHMTEYAILGWLAFAFLGTFEMRQKVHYIAALGFAFCYASTDEFHQLFILGRSGQFTDVCIDTAGAAIGLLLLAILLKIGRRHCAKSVHTLQ
jgi:VanZ family protein